MAIDQIDRTVVTQAPATRVGQATERTESWRTTVTWAIDIVRREPAGPAGV
jgi:hypothetical protein